MSQHYSRRQKSSTEDKEPTPAKHIKRFFSLSKTVALIGSILSIIVASITITNALKGSSATKPTDKSTTTVVIKGGNNSKLTLQHPQLILMILIMIQAQLIILTMTMLTQLTVQVQILHTTIVLMIVKVIAHKTAQQLLMTLQVVPLKLLNKLLTEGDILSLLPFL